MKKIPIRALSMCAFAVTVLSAANAAYAEGSRDLLEQQGYRPYLEWKSNSQMGLPRRNVIYVYAEAGETIEFGSSVPFAYQRSIDLINENLTATSETSPTDQSTWKLSAQIMNDKTRYGINPSDDLYPTIAVTLPVLVGGEAFDPSTATSLTAKPGSELPETSEAYTPGDESIYFFGYTNTKESYTNPPEPSTDENDTTFRFKHYEVDVNGKYIYDTTTTNGIPYRLINDDDDLSADTVKYKEVLTSNTDNGKYSNAPGFIANISQENQESGSEYTPCRFTAPVTGTYAFRFLSMSGNENAASYLKYDKDFFPQDYIYYAQNGTPYDHFRSSENGSTVAAWDITVKNTAGTAQSGRVWTNMLFLDMGGNRTNDVAMNSNVYVLTNDGFKYQVDFNGIDPFGFAFYSNSRGLLLDQYSIYTDPDLQGDTPYDTPYYSYHGNEYEYVRPLLHSFYSVSTSGNDVGDPPIRKETDAFGNPLTAIVKGKLKELQSTVLANVEPVVPGIDVTHKIFFNQPDDDAADKYTKSGGIIDTADEIQSPTNMQISYTGKGSAAQAPTEENNDIPYGTLGIGGEFKVTIPESELKSANVKTLSVKLDFSGYDLNGTTPVTDENKEWELASSAQSDEERNNIVILKTDLTDENGDPLGTKQEVQEAAADENSGDDSTQYEYVYTLIWDGRDAYGNDVPRGTYTQNIVSASWEIGRAHFPLLDVEGNPNGIKITRLNLPTDQNNPADMVFYNNEADPAQGSTTAWYFKDETGGSTASIKIGDNKNMTAGISSTDGAMKYGVEGDRISTEGDHCAIDLWARYTTATNIDISIGVAAPGDNKSTSGAYVSFVAADGTVSESAQAAGTPFTESHVKYFTKDSDNNVIEQLINSYEKTNNKGSETVYGNTISTGFIATLQSLDTGLSSYRDIKWKVNIPTGSYVKVSDEDDLTGSGIALDENAVLTDENEIYNKGMIKKITTINENIDGTLTKSFTYHINTEITGKSSIITGIVIDNLYAPNAVATAGYGTSTFTGTDLNDITDTGIEAGTPDGYKNDPKNGYTKAVQQQNVE